MGKTLSLQSSSLDQTKCNHLTLTRPLRPVTFWGQVKNRYIYLCFIDSYQSTPVSICFYLYILVNYQNLISVLLIKTSGESDERLQCHLVIVLQDSHTFTETLH